MWDSFKFFKLRQKIDFYNFTFNFRTIVRIVDERQLIFDPNEDEEFFFYQGMKQNYRDLLKRPKKDIKFFYDRVFNYSSTNEDVFKETTFGLVDNLMKGCNCSVFAYGATGAGKTFTMTGTKSVAGITYLTMQELFRRIDELQNESECEIRVTYIEVYNEIVKDLLNPGCILTLREDSQFRKSLYCYCNNLFEKCCI